MNVGEWTAGNWLTLIGMAVTVVMSIGGTAATVSRYLANVDAKIAQHDTDITSLKAVTKTVPTLAAFDVLCEKLDTLAANLGICVATLASNNSTVDYVRIELQRLDRRDAEILSEIRGLEGRLRQAAEEREETRA